jgi:hypothetical protein
LTNYTNGAEAIILGEILELHSRICNVSLISLAEQPPNAKPDLVRQTKHLVKNKAELTRQCLVLSEQRNKKNKSRRISVQWFQCGVSLLGQFVNGPKARNDYSELRNQLVDLLLNAASRKRPNTRIAMSRAERALSLTCPCGLCSSS